MKTRMVGSFSSNPLALVYAVTRDLDMLLVINRVNIDRLRPGSDL